MQSSSIPAVVTGLRAGAILILMASPGPTARGAIIHLDPPDQAITPGQSLSIDADADGVSDITFRIFDDALQIHDVSALGVVASDIGAARLDAGAIIGPASGYINVGWFGAGGTLLEPWGSQPDGLVGFRFQNAAGAHFAWARAHVELGLIRFEELAYESAPGVPIAAGVTPSPGALSLLGFWACIPRRRSRR